MRKSPRRIRATVIVACLALAPLQASADPKSTATRTERDLLGPKQVPADAYFGVQTARALENFQISGMKMDFFPEFVQAYAMVKLAAARANAKVGALKRDRLAM